MKKKIHARLILTAMAAIFSTLILITLVFYELFRGQVVEDLKTYSRLIHLSQEAEGIERAGEEAAKDDMRVTLIDSSGQVVYDNEADQLLMDNHGDRPEIAGALEKGEGQDVRKSRTLERSTFYYAVRLPDGGVLRLAKEAGSLYSIFARALPSLALVAAGLLLISFLVAHYLTASLLRPVERLAENLDGEREPDSYEELRPFLATIREQHRDILKSAKIRQEFTANVSHELKTPLTSISGYAELIENRMASAEDTVRFARGIRSNANRLLTLIDDIIRLSELDGEVEDTAFERLNLYELAGACAEMLYLNADNHGVSLALEGSECWITGNRQMIEELLYNFCDNAIRYNNEGGRVEMEVRPGRTGGVLTVRDTGIGIPDEHQERIFERFYRVDKSRSKSTGGTGLGLAIVKHILAIHDADISLESRVGKGTTVRVVFHS